MQILDLGVKDYQETWELQKQLLEKRVNCTIEDTLILVEHPPVYTVGRAGMAVASDASVAEHAPAEIKIKKLGTVAVVEVERGGKLTFHGPGQLVGYPIIALPHHDLRMYLRDIERLLMSTLTEETKLAVRPCPDSLLLDPGQLQTGVWIHDKKIASIGIAVKRWVAYHGFALNLTTDLRYFEAVEPCGFHGSIMTNVAQELSGAPDMVALMSNIKKGLIRRFEALSARYQAKAGGAWLPPQSDVACLSDLA